MVVCGIVDEIDVSFNDELPASSSAVVFVMSFASVVVVIVGIVVEILDWYGSTDSDDEFPDFFHFLRSFHSFDLFDFGCLSGTNVVLRSRSWWR